MKKNIGQARMVPAICNSKEGWRGGLVDNSSSVEEGGGRSIPNKAGTADTAGE